MKQLFTFILLAIISIPVFSCGNEYGYSLDGQKMYGRYFYLAPHMYHFDTLAINKRLDKLEATINNGDATYQTWSDIAVNIMKFGQADSSITILRGLLKEHPKEYNVIANLGTAYELTGQLDSALKYISLGLKINSTSHRGSEWVHVKILEAKIKNKNKRGWLRENEIITVEELIERKNVGGRHRGIENIHRAFAYQIRTRVPFTPAPNRVIANLLTTLGDFNKAEGTYENGLLSYIYAMQFNGADLYYNNKIKVKIAKLNELRATQEKIKELPTAFIRMMKRSRIDPEILLLGIDDFALELDSIQKEEMNRDDSLAIMKTKIDSITANNQRTLLVKSTEFQKLQSKSIYKYWFLLIGLIVGIGLTFLILKKKNK